MHMVKKNGMKNVQQAAAIFFIGMTLFVGALAADSRTVSDAPKTIVTTSMTADSHIYAGISKALYAPKLDADNILVRLSNLEIPADSKDASVEKRERQVVEIAGVIEKPTLVICGEITEHVPVPADLSKISSNVPNHEAGCKSAVKTHMSYRAITCKSSPQYALQQEAYTDNSGIRMVDDCYLVAVGTYYADHVGQKLRVTMSSGLQVMCMVGEFKSDRHTDSTHRYHVGGYENGVYYKGDGSVLEFITDRGYSPDQIPDVFDGAIYNITAL